MRYETLPAILDDRAERHPSNPALRYKSDGVWKDISYGDLAERVRACANALTSLGLGAGDRVAILATNCWEWAVADLGALAGGRLDVPIYPSSTSTQIRYILEHCGARWVFVEDDDQLDKISEVSAHLPALQGVVRFRSGRSAMKGLRLMDMQAFLDLGRGYEGEPSPRPTAEDPATLIYTSGTTGDPKGVVLTHGNIASNVEALQAVADIREDDVALSFLPLSHVFERTVGFYFMLAAGGTIAYAESIEKLRDNLPEIRPSVMCSVPRVYEKLQARILAGVETAPRARRRLVRWALNVADRWGRAVRAGRKPGAAISAQWALADRLVYSKVRAALGGRLRITVSGGAPLSAEVGCFFHGMGLLILEGYGLTETSPVVAANRPHEWRLGTVGKPLPGVQVRIADDGEILVKGELVFGGYFKNEAATAESLDGEGWFRTGDVGEFDGDGFLRITDRKKALIVTSGGKNVAPAVIENRLKGDPYILEAVVCGDRRNYLTALIVPDFEQLKAWAGDNGVSWLETEDLADHPRIHALIQERIRERCKDLARYEQVKKFKLLNKEFSQEDDELTPTLKVRRGPIYKRYAREIDAMYDEAHAVHDAHPAEAARPQTTGPAPPAQAEFQSTIDAARRPRLEETVIGMFLRTVELHGSLPAFQVRDRNRFTGITYRRLARLVREFGTGLAGLGVKPGDHVAIVSDNRLEWIIADLAILGVGAADVPRGADTLPSEMAYILNHSDSKLALVEDARQLEKLQSIRDQVPNLETVVVMDERYEGGEAKDVLTFDEVLIRGRRRVEKDDDDFLRKAAAVKPEDLATIIYTSGTTGRPKGVMLTHANLMANVKAVTPLIHVGPDDRWLSILPSWHAFERTVEYCCMASGCSTAYSKPVRQILLKDLDLVRPTMLASVPRVLEGVHGGIQNKVKKLPLIRRTMVAVFMWVLALNLRVTWIVEDREPLFRAQGPIRRTLRRAWARLRRLVLAPLVRVAQRKVGGPVRQALGGSMRSIISGGGALPAHIDLFFQSAGIPIIEGYGLTETSPVLCVRQERRLVSRTVGPPVPETEIRLLDTAGRQVRPGDKGVVWARGPQIMRGYYKNDEDTRNVLSDEGWFNTGDLGRMTVTGELQLTGRAKDTIVLLSGENVEPEPVESTLKQSSYIAQVMLVGQDRKSLGALVVPDFEAVGRFLNNGLDDLPLPVPGVVARDPRTAELIRNEIRRIQHSPETRAHERVRDIVVLARDFNVGEELTHTLKMKRNIIAEKYKREIDGLYGA